MRQSIINVLAASFLASMASVAAPAAAEEVSVIVSYGDLDLTAPEGAATRNEHLHALIDTPEPATLRARTRE